VDALVMAAGAFGDSDERTLHLARAVEVAERELGGSSYLEKNKGYFWGLVEIKRESDGPSDPRFELRKSPLLDEAVIPQI